MCRNMTSSGIEIAGAVPTAALVTGVGNGTCHYGTNHDDPELSAQENAAPITPLAYASMTPRITP